MIETNSNHDPRPGRYYVTATDSGKFVLLAGPYGNHQAALDKVDEVRRIACDHSPRGVWWAYGTSRLKDDVAEAPIGRMHTFGLIA